MNSWAKLEKATYKRINLSLNLSKMDRIDRMDQIGLNGTKVDWSRPNWTE